MPSSPDHISADLAASSIRDAFAARFGEQEASAIEAAAEDHANGTNDANRGSDPFKWALLIAIGYECISRASFRDHHGISVPWAELKAWIISDAELASHDGDCDYLCALVGGYNEFFGVPAVGETVQ